MPLPSCAGSDRYNSEADDTCPAFIGCRCGDWEIYAATFTPEEYCCRWVHLNRGILQFYWNFDMWPFPVTVGPLSEGAP